MNATAESAGQSVADIDQRDVGGVDLLHRRDHGLDVDRREHDRVALGVERLVDQEGLLRNVVGRGRDVVEHRDPVRLRYRIGAGPHRARDRIASALGEDADGLGPRRGVSAPHQAGDHGREPSTMDFHRALPVAGGGDSRPLLPNSCFLRRGLNCSPGGELPLVPLQFAAFPRSQSRSGKLPVTRSVARVERQQEQRTKAREERKPSAVPRQQTRT